MINFFADIDAFLFGYASPPTLRRFRHYFHCRAITDLPPAALPLATPFWRFHYYAATLICCYARH